MTPIEGGMLTLGMMKEEWATSFSVCRHCHCIDWTKALSKHLGRQATDADGRSLRGWYQLSEPRGPLQMPLLMVKCMMGRLDSHRAYQVRRHLAHTGGAYSIRDALLEWESPATPVYPHEDDPTYLPQTDSAWREAHTSDAHGMRTMKSRVWRAWRGTEHFDVTIPQEIVLAAMWLDEMEQGTGGATGPTLSAFSLHMNLETFDPWILAASMDPQSQKRAPREEGQ